MVTRTQIQIGDVVVDAFMMPDGSYRMSQSQASDCIGTPEASTRRFLTSKAINDLLGKGYAPDTIETDFASGKRGRTRINALPLDVVTAYWLWQAYRGNNRALLLVWSLLTESLERRFDAAFGVTRTPAEYDAALVDRLKGLHVPNVKNNVQSLRKQVRYIDASLDSIATSLEAIDSGLQELDSESKKQ